MSGYHSAVQACHLVPRAESDWFLRNRMDKYNADEVMRGDYALDDSVNAIALRADLHVEFDGLAFVFAPKSPVGERGRGYAIHCLVPTPDTLPTFHNHLTLPLMAVAPELLYARFAYAIFPRLSAFLAGGWSSKRVVRVKAGTGKDQEIVDVAANEFRKPKSRSASPKKRTRQERERDSSVGQGNNGHLTDDCDAVAALSVSPGGISGRKRKRSSSTATGKADSDSDSDSEPLIPYLADFLKSDTHNHGRNPLNPDHPSDDNTTTTSLTPPSQIPPHIWESANWYPGIKRVQKLKRSWILKQRPEGYVPERRWNGEPDDMEGYLAGVKWDDRAGDFEAEEAEEGR